MYLRDALARSAADSRTLVVALYEQARSHLGVGHAGTDPPAAAQPVLLSHHLLAHALGAAARRRPDPGPGPPTGLSPYGSAALAGTSLGLDPEYVAVRARVRRQRAPTRSTGPRPAMWWPRPRTCCAQIGIDLSRLSEEIVLWCTPEFGFVTPGRRVVHRVQHHAAEEEPRRRRAGPGQGGPADRQPGRSAGHAQRPAAGVQPGPAGGQGAGLRLGRPAPRCCCRPSPGWSRR